MQTTAPSVEQLALPEVDEEPLEAPEDPDELPEDPDEDPSDEGLDEGSAGVGCAAGVDAAAVAPPGCPVTVTRVVTMEVLDCAAALDAGTPDAGTPDAGTPGAGAPEAPGAKMPPPLVG